MSIISESSELWRTALSRNGLLHPRFATRYASLFSAYLSTSDPRQLDPCRVRPLISEVVRTHGLGRPIFENLTASKAIRVSGSKEILSVVDQLSSDLRLDPSEFIAAAEWLEASRVPIASDREAKLICQAGVDRALSAVRWSEIDAEVRQTHARTFQDAIANRCQGSIAIESADDYAFIHDDSNRGPMAITWFFGATVEEQLRGNELGASERTALLRVLRQLRTRMRATGLIWQGFAPRNMFFNNSTLTCIDFEKLYAVKDEPQLAREALLWQQVFFADCLNASEHRELFADEDDLWRDDLDGPLRADPFEAAYLGSRDILFRDRLTLLRATLKIEGRHTRPLGLGPNQGILFGHELGHFWGDFLPADEEARLYRVLLDASDDETMVACLEAFEAAMEADICTMILAREGAEIGRVTRRTRATICCIEDCGANAMAGARRNVSEWYAMLDADPPGLVDAFLAAGRGRRLAMSAVAIDDLFVGERSSEVAHGAALNRAVELGLRFTRFREPEHSFGTIASVPDLLARVAADLPEHPTDLGTLVQECEEHLLPVSIRQGHSRYLAFPDCANSVAALVGGVLAKFLNQNLIAVDRSAPVATFIDIQVTEWLRELIGYESTGIQSLNGVGDVAGLWTPGGHLSNHIAMLAALGRAFPNVRREGLRSIAVKPTVLMAGGVAHYSHSDSAFHLGLGWSAIRPIATSADYTMSPEALARALDDHPEDEQPFMVVAVAGNCRTTAIDNLENVSRICAGRNVWLHVDACHGGALLFSPRLKSQYLRGIGAADSVSIDPHKGLFTPYASSYVLFKDRGVLRHFSRHHLAVNRPDVWDLGLVMPFLGSRGFDSLATWLLMRHIGLSNLGAIIESRQALTRHLEQLLWDSGMFVCLNDVDFYRITFVFVPGTCRQFLRSLAPGMSVAGALAKLVSGFTSRIGRALYESATLCLDEHTLPDLGNRVGLGADVTYTVLAACPGSPLLTVGDIAEAAREMIACARTLEHEFIKVIESAGVCDHDADVRAIGGPAGWAEQH